jgi:hypothetical protein
MSTPLDNWLPHPHVRLRYARSAAVTPERLWQAASEVRLADTRTMRRLIRWRLGRHAPAAATTYRDMFRSGIFTLLEEGERYSVSGAAGRIWAPSGDYARLESGDEYREWSKAGTAKVAFMVEVRDHERGSQIVSESRVLVQGRRTRVVFRGFWAVIGPFSRYVGSEVLAAVVRRAEEG